MSILSSVVLPLNSKSVFQFSGYYLKYAALNFNVSVSKIQQLKLTLYSLTSGIINQRACKID